MMSCNPIIDGSEVSILFCPTVPHTGTTFMLEFFKADPKIKSFQSLEFLQRFHGDWFVPGLNLIHTHFDKDLFDLIVKFREQWPIVVSLRDPLLSVLTRINRGTGRSPLSLIDGFIKLVEMIDKGPTAYEPIYLPFDLMEYLPAEERTQWFVGALAPLSYLDQSHCKKWARNWIYIGSRGDYSFKSLYQSKEVEKIKKLIPGEWAALKEARPILQPFLEAQGYKNLLWWTN